MIVSAYSFLLAALASMALTKAIPADLDSLVTRAPSRPSCPGGNPNSPYTVKKGDTPVSISIAKNVSTLNLLAVNGLKEQSRLVPNQKLVWKVRPGNTCVSIAVAFGLELSRFFGYNPGIINPDCDNITPGTNVCLDNSRGSNFPFAVRPGNANPRGIKAAK
ncbi:MAG: hypothetical protein Q9163_003253 [Psora crenata]